MDRIKNEKIVFMESKTAGILQKMTCYNVILHSITFLKNQLAETFTISFLCLKVTINILFNYFQYPEVITSMTLI